MLAANPPAAKMHWTFFRFTSIRLPEALQPIFVAISRRMLFFELELDIFDLIKSAPYNLDCIKIEQGNIVTLPKALRYAIPSNSCALKSSAIIWVGA
jgi:hypothetical protein